MANRWSPMHEAVRFAEWVLADVGRELRVARITSGLTQAQVGLAIGRSASWVSRVERGRNRSVALQDHVRHGAAVGLKLYIKSYPGGRRPLDAGQLALLTSFNARLHPSWRRQLEVVMPTRGDLRAADELIRIDSVSCAVEAVTRFADVQSQSRTGLAKQRDIGADRLILVVKGSHANRRVLNAAGPIIADYFPIPGRDALRALAAGRDPGGDSLVVI
jgi:transcriptional regulator with XRE-family HTH domain